jgi:ABC-type transport system substrate-binding protein
MWRDTTDSMAAYTANPNYFRVGSPGVERLEILYLSEGTRFATLVTGQVDFLRLEEPDALRAVDRNPDLLVSRNRVAGTGVEFAINAGRPLMGTSAARQAILAAVAPYETVSEVWGDSGFVAVGLPVGNPGWLLPESEVKGILGRFAGQGVLSIAGGDLGTLKVGLFDDRVTEHAGIIADSLIAMGANVEIETITTRQFGDEVWFGGQYDMFLGFQPPISSFSNLLFSVYHSQGAWNTTGVSSPELDSLIEQQAVEQDPESRRNMALEIQRTILKDAHRIGAASRADGWVYWPHITGFTASLPRGAPDFLARIRTE